MKEQLRLPQNNREFHIPESVRAALAIAGGQYVDIDHIHHFSQRILNEYNGVLKQGPVTFVSSYALAREIFMSGDKPNETGWTDKGFTKKIFDASSFDAKNSRGGLIGSSGDIWQRIREPLYRAFRPDRFSKPENIDKTYELYETWIKSLDPDKQVNIHKEIKKLTFTSLMRDVFEIPDLGEKESAEIIKQVRQLYTDAIPLAALAAARRKFKGSVSIPVLGRIWQDHIAHRMPWEVNKTKVQDFVEYILEVNKQNPHETLVNSLLAAVKKYEETNGEEGITYTDLVDTLPELVSAGYGTTANTLPWVLWGIDSLPDEKKQAFYSAVKAGPRNILMQKNEWSSLIEDIMSRRAQTTLLFRGVTRDIDVNYDSQRIHFNKGDQLVIFTDAVISDGRNKGEDVNNAIFIMGPRVCIGKFMAKQQSSLFLKAIADADIHFQFSDKPRGKWIAGEDTPTGKAVERVEIIPRIN